MHKDGLMGAAAGGEIIAHSQPCSRVHPEHQSKPHRLVIMGLVNMNTNTHKYKAQ